MGRPGHRLGFTRPLVGAVDAPLAPLWVWRAFNELPSPSTLIGGSIVFGAVAVHLIVAENTAH